MHITIDTIFERLPHTDCGDCGEPTCRSFAMKVATDLEQEPTACPHLDAAALEKLNGLKSVFRTQNKMALIVDEDRCTACYDCIWVCPVNLTLWQLDEMTHGAMPLVMKDDVVKVASHCGALRWCVECVEVCPVDAIKLV